MVVLRAAVVDVARMISVHTALTARSVDGEVSALAVVAALAALDRRRLVQIPVARKDRRFPVQAAMAAVDRMRMNLSAVGIAYSPESRHPGSTKQDRMRHAGKEGRHVASRSCRCFGGRRLPYQDCQASPCPYLERERPLPIQASIEA